MNFNAGTNLRNLYNLLQTAKRAPDVIDLDARRTVSMGARLRVSAPLDFSVQCTMHVLRRVVHVALVRRRAGGARRARDSMAICGP